MYTYNPADWVMSTDENIRSAQMREMFKKYGVLKPAKSKQNRRIHNDNSGIFTKQTTV